MLQNPVAGACDGSFTVATAGGVGPYTYSLDGGITFTNQNSYNSLCAGQYTIVVIDANLCMAYDTINVLTPASSVWPGDTNDDNVANNLDLLPIGLHHGATGTTRANASTNWTCQPSIDWGTGTTGNLSVDIKHIDCDGNGTINSIDTNAIILNWAQTHLKSGGTSINNNNATIDIFIDSATANPGDTLSLPIILGSSGTPNNGYGIAFTITYDPAGIDTNSIQIDFSNSWLGNINSNMIGISKDFYTAGEVEVAMTRIDHNSALGSGVIGHITFTIKDDVLPKFSNSSIRLDFNVKDVQFIDTTGGDIPTIPLPTQMLVVSLPTGQSVINSKSNSIIAYPNPTSGELRIQSSQEAIEEIQVFDVMGNMVIQKTAIDNLQTTIDLNKMPSGVYLVNVQSETQNKNIRIIKH